MTAREAMADVFITAFRSLSPAEQDAILAKMVRNQALREDLIDLAIAEARSHERGKSFRSFLTELKKKRIK